MRSPRSGRITTTRRRTGHLRAFFGLWLHVLGLGGCTGSWPCASLGPSDSFVRDWQQYDLVRVSAFDLSLGLGGSPVRTNLRGSGCLKNIMIPM